jgi:membrane protease YdiL (CAAX protease family)
MPQLNKPAAIRAAVVLCVLAAIEGGFILAYPDAWLSAAFRHAANVGFIAWIAAAIVTVGYIFYSIRGLPTVAALLGRLSPYKLFALVVAIPSSIVEEVFFRGSLMNLLATHHQNLVVQILASGIAFGMIHLFWGIRGGMSAVYAAVRSTTLLGLGLAVVFVTAGRIVFPCVVAHFTVNLVLEPWLLYAYVLRAQSKRSSLGTVA